MMVSGDTAKAYDAVRLDSLMSANKGELVSAAEDTGVVVYKDRTGAHVTQNFGPHAIKILRR